MLTVLIAEKEHIDAIRQENKLFFEPFLESKELAFCYWNTEGQSLRDSVPGLVEAVGRTKEWRAVIINKTTEESLQKRNPFDAVDCSELSSLVEPKQQPDRDEALEEWEKCWIEYYEALAKGKEAVYKKALGQPLQKLSTWLCFRPEDYVLNDVGEKQDVHEWAMERLQRDDEKPSAKLELLERQQYKNELRMKENIRREFVGGNHLNLAYPMEIHSIALRTAENSFFDPDSFWTVRKASEYSAYADRNMYFDKMRFLVFDLLPNTHRNFRTDYIRFLASVLIFSSNPIPGSAMQARRLYRLESEADDTPLCTLVTSYDRKLLNTSDVIENEMEKIRGEIPSELSDKDAENLFCTVKEINVSLDESCNREGVLSENEFGLFFDSPENEYDKWAREYRASEKALSYIAKQQKRSVKKGVGQMQMSENLPDVNVSRLTPLQLDDIRDYTNAAEKEMMDSVPLDLKDGAQYMQRLSEESEKVKKVISHRMTKTTVFVLMGICLGMYLLCLLPFLFSNNGTPGTVTTAIVLVACMLGALAGTLLVTLFVLRKSVTDAVSDYNSTAHGILTEIDNALKSFSKYLSTAYTVRRGHAVLRSAQKDLDEYTKSLHIRKKHQEDIRKMRAIIAEHYGDYLGDRTYCDETMSRPYEYDFDQKTEYEYPAPFLAGDCRQIEFVSSGNTVTVPSSYITRISVKMEGIYE